MASALFSAASIISRSPGPLSLMPHRCSMPCMMVRCSSSSYSVANCSLLVFTFDYTEGDVISGDLFISLDTVKTNSEQFATEYDEELHRTIIHGILHLCGINDKGPGEREIMEAAENKALAMRG